MMAMFTHSFGGRCLIMSLIMCLFISPPGINCSAPNECPHAMCMMQCPEAGFDVDDNGCKICQCKVDPPFQPVACPIMECADPCRHGYTLDVQGCQSCECNADPPPQPAACPVMACADPCPRGYTLDAQGCQLCECIVERSDCLEVMCLMSCPSGQMLDATTGCPTCLCVEEKRVCSDTMCAMFCQFGFVQGDSGCPQCVCASDPCLSLKCTDEQVCVRTDKQYVFTATCKPVRHWCPLRRCRMFCERGFVTDNLGCETCKCREQSPRVCPPIPQACHNECPFGYSFDEDGCPSCNCLPNACLDLTCPMDGQVCESHARTNCPRCPVTPRCIDGTDVRRVHISLTYKHENNSTVTDKKFGQLVVTSLAGIINSNSCSLVGLFINKTPQEMQVSVHLISSAESQKQQQQQLVNMFNVLKTTLVTDSARGEIRQGSSTYTPDPQSITAIYYTSSSIDGDEWTWGQEEDTSMVPEEGLPYTVDYLATYLMMTVLAVCLLLFLAICCVCFGVFCTNGQLPSLQTKNNNIYRPINRV